MRAGRLRNQITLQQPAKGVADSYGASAATWADVADVWAEIEELSGIESLGGRAIAADLSHRVVIRWRSDVKPTWRIRWGDRYLYPTAVNADAKRTNLELLCRETVNV